MWMGTKPQNKINCKDTHGNFKTLRKDHQSQNITHQSFSVAATHPRRPQLQSCKSLKTRVRTSDEPNKH
jgi:hypothetical protein